MDNPTCAEIRDVCISLGLNCDVEVSTSLSFDPSEIVMNSRLCVAKMNKHYCRDLSRDPTFAGRVRVQLRNADGSPSSEQFPHSKTYYRDASHNFCIEGMHLTIHYTLY